MDSLNAKEQQAKAASWMDSILSLIPGRKQNTSNEPSDEAIRRTHDYLRCAPAPSLPLGLMYHLFFSYAGDAIFASTEGIDLCLALLHLFSPRHHICISLGIN